MLHILEENYPPSLLSPPNLIVMSQRDTRTIDTTNSWPYEDRDGHSITYNFDFGRAESFMFFNKGTKKLELNPRYVGDVGSWVIPFTITDSHPRAPLSTEYELQVLVIALPDSNFAGVNKKPVF